MNNTFLFCSTFTNRSESTF